MAPLFRQSTCGSPEGKHNDIKGCQKQLVQQLMSHIQESPGPPTRKLIARCLATLFSVGDTFLLFDTVNKCNDILKNKDDSPSFLPTRLAAICCVGTMYEKLGRMMGRSYEETVHILIRSLRNGESQTRIEIMLTLEKVCAGMGSAISNVHKDIYKAARHCLIDRVMAVRCAATRCLLEMLNHAPFLYMTELESLATLCFRGFDGSNYEVRCAVAKFLGALIAMTQQHQPSGKTSQQQQQQQKGLKTVSLDEALGILMGGFLRGGVGFLKGTGEIIKGSSGVNREVRVGVTHNDMGEEHDKLFQRLVNYMEQANEKQINVLKSEVAKIKSEIKTEIAEIKNIVDEESKKQKDLQEKQQNIQVRLTRVEVLAKKNNIIFGLKQEGENLLDYIINQLNLLLGISLNSLHINNLYTIGNKQENSPVLVQFTTYLTKLNVLKQCKKLKVNDEKFTAAELENLGCEVEVDNNKGDTEESTESRNTNNAPATPIIKQNDIETKTRGNTTEEHEIRNTKVVKKRKFVTTLADATQHTTKPTTRNAANKRKTNAENSLGSPRSAIAIVLAYVTFVQILGSVWLEKNMKTFLNHILYLVANPKAASSHVDAVYSRKCINFILRSVFGKMLGEKAQTSACKDIAQTIVKEMNSIDFNPENAKEFNQETLYSQHLLVCALQEIGSLVLSLGTTAHDLITDQSLNFIDVTISVLIHPCQAARLAAAWCLRCICIAVPSQISPLIDRCVSGIEQYRTSPEAISGYSSALAAVLGGVKLSPLGVPHMKGKIIFNTAEELLRSASQNSRLSLNRTHAGGLLPRMLLLWRNSFPRSAKELESEKARGDIFTWQVTLEGRAGALSAMHSFLQNCPELINEDTTRRLLTPIESALAMLMNISGVLKTYGQQLKAPAAMVRLRLCETLLLLHPQSYENSFTHLLRMLVAEFTLTENPANTTTSQLRTVCHADDSVILGTWLQETDHRTIEDQMEPNRRADGEHLQPNSAAGSGALEHDPCCLYHQVQSGELIPGPLPLGVAVIDISVLLFGQIFPRVTNKHRVQMLDHFAECIKLVRSTRQEAVQMNVFTALLSGLKGLTETKVTLNQEDVKKSAVNLIIGALTSSNPVLRCAAGEAPELAQTSFDRLKSARDVASRTGHSLALGCLHKYVGGMGSSQHLNTSVSILLALAQDQTSPIVQVWSLHALALIIDSGGPMFRGYVEPSLSLALKLLLNVPQSYIDVHQCIGKVLSALITTIGPELQGNTPSICTARSSLLCACAIMQDHQDPLVQAEATGCLQQLHLFAPRHVNLSSLVPTLCRTLSSNHLLLRKAAISCLRQLAQREAREVCEHAMTLASESRDNNTVEGLVITETGLPGVFFSMLDTETDAGLIKDIHETIISMLQVLAADNLSQWLGLCKDVLTVATDTNNEDRVSLNTNDGEENDGEVDDDQAEFHAEEDASHPAVQPRWPTRVFAAECVRKNYSSV
ncbi:hypothetical protein NQ317_010853 [Molorchus minor]|uniref:HEAT repeat-containing protein 5B n=1 Tax=Molorchus minor TaxID=1323400 RepID=A0ABQ9K1D0_9CUCU|nr:hypothetical protein NQ317_010853 [Molorchus minor]